MEEELDMAIMKKLLMIAQIPEEIAKKLTDLVKNGDFYGIPSANLDTHLLDAAFADLIQVLLIVQD